MERITRMCLLLVALLVSGPGFANTIDINTADAQALATSLTGVGEAKARAIVAYRDQNGPFKRADDLKQVKGISDRILELNRGTISTGSAATP